ncbi:autotransporter outer membrane beta-barrel domain-containing protein [Persicitalea jodogahamensis]|uniref:Outer membrane protein beta-barrel domain-containing protein n=1 Tax=Persicitalea jodogahamensis TaxID=402147 RepID=A0A8J3D588_9BACT|nr:autotransporter outer membrane beta-barrel domain-containing protein [Persicitalea jodogahamensis]GHB76295.1 hypothetical protein GCM10007390_32750 [Persicitalea jodogahamensis]
MKNFILALTISGLCLPVLAQTPAAIPSSSNPASATMQKGQLFIGANGTGGGGRGEGLRSTTWSGTGQLGYFIARRWATGLQFSYGNYRSINNLAGASSFFPQPIWKRNESNFSPELFTRYYFTDWKVKPFVQASTGWNLATGEYIEVNGETTNIRDNSFTAKAALGVSFRIGKRASVDLLYSKSLTRYTTPTTFADLDGLRLGGTFLIGK